MKSHNITHPIQDAVVTTVTNGCLHAMDSVDVSYSLCSVGVRAGYIVVTQRVLLLTDGKLFHRKVVVRSIFDATVVTSMFAIIIATPPSTATTVCSDVSISRGVASGSLVH